MTIVYLIGTGILVLLLYYISKSYVLNNTSSINQTNLETQSKSENEIDINIDSQNNIPMTSELTSKNKWLYPTDNIGKMESGVVYDLQNFAREIDESDSTNFIIKKRRSQK